MENVTVNNAVIEYLKTGDEQYRNILYSKYFKTIDKMVSKLNVSKQDKEDISQNLKEYMVLAINKVLSLELKTKNYINYFSTLLSRKIKEEINKINQEANICSLNTVEIYSNANLFNEVESNIITKDVIETLFELEKKPENKDLTRLIKRYGIGCKPKTITDISIEEGYHNCNQDVSQSILTAKRKLYEEVCKKYPMTKKDDILISLATWEWEIIPPTFDDTNEEYITYSNYDDISNSHQYRLK